MFQDLRYGLRMLRKNPGFTLIAVLSLGIGIGATTTVFSVANAVLFRPLPFKDSAELVGIHKYDPNGSGLHVISYPDYLDYLDRNEVLSELVAWSEAAISLSADGPPALEYGAVVSGNYFPTLGVQPALGRFFGPDEDRIRGGHPVTVISFALWQRRFGGDSSVIGQKIKLDGHPFTIIGVAPKEFTSTYSVFAPALFVPLAMQAQVLSTEDRFGSRMSSYLKLNGRLRPGVSREQAQIALNNIDRQLELEHPQQGETSSRPTVGLEVVPIGSFPVDILLGIFGAAVFQMAIVGFVLIIASANVAGMLLARATTRQREIAVRLAMGATRARLIRQLLTESGLLFLFAAAAGVLLTVWLTRAISTFSFPYAMPVALDAKVDWRVLSFTLLLSLATGLIFGLAPAVSASKSDLLHGLKDAPSMLGLKRSRLRNAFVIGQIALSMVLLVGAGLFTRAINYAQTVYPGKEPETVLTADFDPHEHGYNATRAFAFYQTLIDRISTSPGVERVSLASALNIGDGYTTTSLIVQGDSEETSGTTQYNAVAPNYFETMGIALMAGRDFTPADREGAPRVVIVDEATARRFWSGNAIGRLVKVGGTEDWAEVVGVVENSRHRVSGQATPPFVYASYMQRRGNNTRMTLVMRHQGDTPSVIAAVQNEVQLLDPYLPLQSAMSLADAVKAATLPLRIASTIASTFGIIGLALAALGVYGLVSHSVNQRTHEMGIRVALGAQRGEIFKLVVGHGIKLGLIGVTIGVALSLALTRVLTSFLFGVSASDPITYLSVSLLLVTVALGASFSPARKAARMDPLVSLRHE
jgi:putative ABC transport system permease protein